MYTFNEYILTILLGCLTLVKTQICDLNCGPGYRCTLRPSACDYPPCPKFPTCAVNKPQPNSLESQKFGEGLCKKLVNDPPALAFANTERPGQCPSSPLTGPCINSCRMDNDCPQLQKCCANECGRSCRSTANYAVQKPGSCPRRLSRVTVSCRQECNTDTDCSGFKKCCTTSCGAKCSDPCYYWLRSRHRLIKKSFFGTLPFICRV